MTFSSLIFFLPGIKNQHKEKLHIPDVKVVPSIDKTYFLPHFGAEQISI